MASTQNQQSEVRQMFLRYRTLYAVYLVGLLFYGISVPLLAAAVMPSGRGVLRLDTEVVRWMGMGMAVAAMVLAAVSVIVLPNLTSPQALASRAGMRQPVPVAAALYRGLVLRVLCAELIALFGLALVLVTGSLSAFYGFLLPAMACHALALPRYTQWWATIERVQSLRSDWGAG
jgi:hypothetical protein